jgi:hypothetical protein
MPLESYTGRVQRVYVTRNTEYHVLGDLCVAVRDLRTGVWKPDHTALQRRIKGSIRVRPGGTWDVTRDMPGVGAVIYFGGQGPMTSQVQQVRLPTSAELEHYEQIGRSGTG